MNSSLFILDNIKDIKLTYILLFLLLLLLVFLLNDFIFKKIKSKKNDTITNELFRKVPHIFSGILFLFVVLFFEKSEAVVFSFIVFFAAIFNNYLKLFSAINKVRRFSWGTVLFPLSMIFLFLVFWEEKQSMAFAILVLTLADSAAALKGKYFKQKYGNIKVKNKNRRLKNLENKWEKKLSQNIFRNGKIGQKIGQKIPKTWAGSIAFFFVTFLLFWILKFQEIEIFSDGSISWGRLLAIPFLIYFLWSLLLSFILTILEFFLIYGVDNLVLPIAASYLYLFF